MREVSKSTYFRVNFYPVTSAPSSNVGPDSVLLNYIYFRGTCTDSNVHFFDIICERNNFAFEKLKSYLIHNHIC